MFCVEKSLAWTIQATYVFLLSVNLIAKKSNKVHFSLCKNRFVMFCYFKVQQENWYSYPTKRRNPFTERSPCLLETKMMRFPKYFMRILGSESFTRWLVRVQAGTMAWASTRKMFYHLHDQPVQKKSNNLIIAIRVWVSPSPVRANKTGQFPKSIKEQQFPHLSKFKLKKKRPPYWTSSSPGFQ